MELLKVNNIEIKFGKLTGGVTRMIYPWHRDLIGDFLGSVLPVQPMKKIYILIIKNL